jgi:hypothetical protein
MELDTHSNIGGLIEVTLREAQTLERDALPGDAFLLSTISLLTSVNVQGREFANEEMERLGLLGRAAVRSYQSFDSIDAADRFVELACKVSAAIHSLNAFMRCLRDAKTLAGGAALGEFDQPHVIDSMFAVSLRLPVGKLIYSPARGHVRRRSSGSSEIP